MEGETAAMMLRRLGETVDGSRDSEQALVFDAKLGGNLNVVSKREFDDHHGSGRFTLVKHFPPPPPRQAFAQFDKVAFLRGKDMIACVAPPTDCVFWTDSAIEKFLYPYYEQVRIFPETYLQQLKATIRDPKKRKHIIAVRHDSPSSSETVTANDCGKIPAPGAGNVMLLTVDLAEEGGQPRWLSLREFDELYARTANRG